MWQEMKEKSISLYKTTKKKETGMFLKGVLIKASLKSNSYHILERETLSLLCGRCFQIKRKLVSDHFLCCRSTWSDCNQPIGVNLNTGQQEQPSNSILCFKIYKRICAQKGGEGL